MKILFYLLVILSCISCNIRHKATLKELENKRSNYQMSYDATRRGAVISVDSTGKIDKILSEVQPDAAIATTTDITSKLTGKLKTGDSVSAEQITKIAETLSKLGERTAPVNMLRDALYRLEEHCINFSDDCKGDRYFNSFDKVVNLIVELQAEISETAANEARAEEAKTMRTLTPTEREKYNLK
ncbi:hypothetical protein EG349_09885 [Chryseobacterium shandongense]|uniref:Lipoprotein n=2 Tax=Chryseobacterium shandongense TaxID=1493872 RepID=A0A3G6MT85_9FLAO|nr:hypothetical protein [Chryseobacterium shandongense]AZA58971.1 hypothetical protein EG350_18065 [Chryseobacterium shandongense]AZA87068.1 hypothetical protein EG349_09885 [Chryseobacterium shandongense]AZA95498.1 hypothetical protein EG353_07965 [Chryseobacterium shandongense]